MAVMFGLAVLDMARVMRRGPLRPGAGALFIRPADVIVFVGGIAVMLVGVGLLVGRAGPALPSWTAVAIDTAIATLLTLPVALRELQGAIKSLVVAVAVAASAVVALLGVGTLVAPLAEAGAPRLAHALLVGQDSASRSCGASSMRTAAASPPSRARRAGRRFESTYPREAHSRGTMESVGFGHEDCPPASCRSILGGRVAQ
jgi:hypothetical protein